MKMTLTAKLICTFFLIFQYFFSRSTPFGYLMRNH